MIVIKCWETRKYSSEPLETRLFVASSQQEAEQIKKLWYSQEEEGYQRNAVILEKKGNELVPASYNISQEEVESLEREEW